MIDLSIGDRVRVRDWEDMEDQFGLNESGNINCPYVFATEMRYLCGTVFTISKIRDGRCGVYLLNSEEKIENTRVNAFSKSWFITSDMVCRVGEPVMECDVSEPDWESLMAGAIL